MSERDRDRWNQRWRERADRGDPIAPPSTFVTGARLPARGRAVDLAGGAGRHALWLARRGLDVTLVDISDDGLAMAARAAADAGLPLRCLRADLEVEPPPPGPWDVALCFHYLHRPLLAGAAAQLAPGGLLLFCQPTVRNLERHDHPRADYLLAEGEAATLVPGLELVSCEEGWSDEGRHEARVIWRR